jgi:hypothetical protein
MSWGTCIKGSDNIHFNYPALMSDSRIYTNYNSSCKINRDIIERNKIKTNNGYRKFLINNSDKIMRYNKKFACDNCGVCNYGYPLQDANNAPRYLYKSYTDKSTPYGYETSDLKQIYLSRDELQKRLHAPLLNQSELLYFKRSN